MNLQDKLIKLYNEIDELKNKKSSSDSDFKAWRTDVQLCLSGLYGEKSIQLKNFNNRPFSPMVIVGNTDFHEPYVRDLETTKKEFERYIGDFEDVSTDTNVKNHISVNNKVFSGAKKVLLPITSAADLGTVPSDLVGAFSLIFYSSPEEAVFKALGALF